MVAAAEVEAGVLAVAGLVLVEVGHARWDEVPMPHELPMAIAVKAMAKAAATIRTPGMVEAAAVEVVGLAEVDVAAAGADTAAEATSATTGVMVVTAADTHTPAIGDTDTPVRPLTAITRIRLQSVTPVMPAANPA